MCLTRLPAILTRLIAQGKVTKMAAPIIILASLACGALFLTAHEFWAGLPKQADPLLLIQAFLIAAAVGVLIQIVRGYVWRIQNKIDPIEMLPPEYRNLPTDHKQKLARYLFPFARPAYLVGALCLLGLMLYLETHYPDVYLPICNVLNALRGGNC